MTSRWRWVKAMPRVVIQDRRYHRVPSDNRGLKVSSQFIRLVEDNSSSEFNNSRESEMRLAAPTTGGHEHWQSGRALKEEVSSLINSVFQGTAAKSHDYVDILQRCCKQKDLESVQQLHDCINQSGLEQHPYVANNLLKCYIRCGRLQNAQALFEKLLNKDIVTWNIMVGGYAEHDQGEDAVKVYKQMRNEGEQPNAVTYLAVLKACSSPVALTWGKDIHAHIIHDGYQADVRVINALLHMYAKCGSLDDARTVFDKMVVRDLISWNAIIGGLAQHGHGHEAFSLFQQMQKEGFTPDSVTYLCILSARAGPKDLAWVKEVHSHATTFGLSDDLRVNNALIHMYTKCDSLADAKLVLDSMTDRNVISWNVMIGGLARHGRGREAFSCFQQMQSEGLVPDSATCVNILNANSCEGSLPWVKEVDRYIVSSGLNVDLRVSNALLHMYAKSGCINDARAVFDRMGSRNLISWTAMIGGLAQQGLGQEAFSLFLQLQREGFIPDVATYVSILNPSSSTGALEWVREVHTQAMKVGLDVDLRVGNALLQMYAKIGSLTDARQVFDKMIDRDVFTWTLMIAGLAQHGQGEEAVQLFNETRSKDLKPDGQLFLALLSACSHAGLVEEGRLQFESMTRDFGIKPTLEHCTCMVDLLGRAGHLEEAKRFISNMSTKPDIVTWKALLGACRTYGNLALAEFAAKECVKFEAKNTTPYVLLSNIYAAKGDWDQRSGVRRMMMEKGIRKDPGRTWISIDNKIHNFLAGDTSHPEAREIYAMLSSLSEKLKAEGYIPDTRLVLMNIDEGDKEKAMFSHSEKLAIAYGLIHVPEGEPIRIYKNLRMCTDCHAATKIITKVTGREIVARDRKRFHHFKDGECSCGEYW